MADTVRVRILAVGQGMSNLIEVYDKGKLENVIVVDCGGGDKGTEHVRDCGWLILDAMKRRAKAIKPYSEIAVLDLLIISHQDRDHHSIMKGLLAQLKNKVEIRQFIRFDESYCNLQFSYTVFRDAVIASMPDQSNHFYFPNGSGYQRGGGCTCINVSGGVTLTAIYANERGSMADTNVVSAIVELETTFTPQTHRFLFPGDPTRQTMVAVSAAPIPAGYSSNIMSAPHHGSFETCKDGASGGTTTLNRFLTQMKPAEMIVSAGVDNTYGHPHASFIATAETVMTGSSARHELLYNTTDQSGTANLSFKKTTKKIYSTAADLSEYDHYCSVLTKRGVSDSIEETQVRRGTIFAPRSSSLKAVAVPGCSRQSHE